MNCSTLLADPAALEIDAFVSESDAVTIRVHSRQPLACCPLCGQPSGSLKGRYVRHLADLPWHGVAVRLEWRTREFRCRNELCQRKVFCERLPQVAAAYGRRTLRLDDTLTWLGFALGGRAGSRTASRLRLAAGKDTLLRLLREQGAGAGDANHPVKILGVDDFAFRKGQTYGTILVDLERRKVIDLLPNREAETLKLWLETHPEVGVVSRDRAAAYADGATRGAPQARQVADRFHLLKNAREALETFLGRQYQALRQARQTVADAKGKTLADEPVKPAAATSERIHSGCSQRRRERFQQIQELHARQYPVAAIARALKMHRRTVRLFLRCAEPPARKRARRESSLRRFVPYLRERWAAGVRNASQLWRELGERGFRGCQSSVRRFLRGWREQGPPRMQGRSQPPSPRFTSWLLLRPELCRQEWQGEYAEELCRAHEAVRTASDLAGKFCRLLKQGTQEGLKEWLKEAQDSGIAEMASFANGIKQDESAVVAAIETEWSNGQVEGQVNRLKTLKRAMYGRAKFDLLRARVLYAG